MRLLLINKDAQMRLIWKERPFIEFVETSLPKKITNAGIENQGQSK